MTYDPYSATRGHHLLPQHFQGMSTPAPRPRPKRTGLVLGILGGVLVVGALTTAQLSANLGYDNADSLFDGALSTTTTAKTEVTQEKDEAMAATEFARLIHDGDSGTLVDAASRDALGTALTEADSVVVAAEELADAALPSSSEKPTFFWELFGATALLDAQRTEVNDLAAAFHDETESLGETRGTVTDAALAVLTSAANAAPAFEAAHISAKNDAVIALRDAAADAATVTVLDAGTVDAFTSLEAAATNVITTEQTELAEKAGPLQGTRLEIEAFARSLAPGVLLEFDWSPIVNGFGPNGGMGGYTTWWWNDPDRAVIELSNSVAEQWPADRSKALVAHEVGHAISVKCEGMYDASTQDSIEMWATAWAIGMGFTDDANGVWAYRYPPQSYIDAAMGCR